MLFNSVIVGAIFGVVIHLPQNALAHQSDPLPTAVIDSGPIIGTTTRLPSATAVVNQFLGVPFAAPPERFAPPVRPQAQTQAITTQNFSASCVQQFNFPEAARNFTIAVFNQAMPEESEDCLYLNVYSSAAPPPPEGRAVMFWIYGGGLQFGTAGQPAYDGSWFAGYEDIVLVTVNYRTNVFGFPSSPELPLQGHNLGFLDQRLGLDWVQRNIHHFGGNSSKVTIFGESAGGTSVDALLTSFARGTEPPFRAAILESGQTSIRPPAVDNSLAAWNTLVTAVGCTGPQNLSCVASKPATQLKSVIERNALDFNPIADNVTLVSDPAARRARGEIAVIPTLSGTNAQEGRVFTFGQTNTTAFVEATFPELVPAQQQEIIAAYPLGQMGLQTEFDQLAQIDTEFAFQCPEAFFANATADSGIPAWRYYYNASFPNLEFFPNGGVYHSTEIAMVFRSYNKSSTTAQQNVLSDIMQGAWAKMAKNPSLGPGWNRIGTGSSFAEGAEDLDLGVFQPNGIQVERQSTVDFRCGLFAPLYPAIGS